MSKEDLDRLAADHPRSDTDKTNGEGPGPADPKKAEPEAGVEDATLMLEPDPQMVTVCAALAGAIFAIITTRKGWEPLSPPEMLKIGEAAALVAAQYGVLLGPKAAAWYALGLATAAAVLPRQAAAAKRHEVEPEMKTGATAPAAGLPEGYEPPAAGSDTSAPDPESTAPPGD